MIFWILIYWLLCAFIVIGTDDGEPWTVGDKTVHSIRWILCSYSNWPIYR